MNMSYSELGKHLKDGINDKDQTRVRKSLVAIKRKIAESLARLPYAEILESGILFSARRLVKPEVFNDDKQIVNNCIW